MGKKKFFSELYASIPENANRTNSIIVFLDLFNLNNFIKDLFCLVDAHKLLLCILSCLAFFYLVITASLFFALPFLLVVFFAIKVFDEEFRLYIIRKDFEENGIF